MPHGSLYQYLHQPYFKLAKVDKKSTLWLWSIKVK